MISDSNFELLAYCAKIAQIKDKDQQSMAKYVVHKLAFFYTDEDFVAGEDEKGSIIGITSVLDEARQIKHEADIVSMQNLSGYLIIEFGLGKVIDEDIKQLLVDIMGEDYCKRFSKDFDYYECHFPENMTKNQAGKFIDALELTFHNIIEYGDDEKINPAEFEIDEDSMGAEL